MALCYMYRYTVNECAIRMSLRAVYVSVDCRSTCHPDCKDNLPLPCIPLAPGTPGGNKLVGVSISQKYIFKGFYQWKPKKKKKRKNEILKTK